MGHRLGQVFLTDPNILRKIQAFASVTATDHIVEVGCGPGQLSEQLAQRCGKLTIIEYDRTYLEQTKHRLATFSHIDYHHCDVLRISYDTIVPQPFKWVANLPYYLSAKFMQLLVANRIQWTHATLMLQDEFAKKLLAEPNTTLYCSLGIYCQFYCTIEYGFKVAKTCFRPIPNVDSAVIQLTVRPKPLFDGNQTLFFQIVKSAFWGRRKPLMSALKKSPFFTWHPHYASLPIWDTLQQQRGETLSIAQFHQLACALDATK